MTRPRRPLRRGRPLLTAPLLVWVDDLTATAGQFVVRPLLVVGQDAA
ncbi:hypothetical protein [Deinococcus aestuarii]|nr:hypothetical protein [Deinococcus aestuarii]